MRVAGCWLSLLCAGALGADASAAAPTRYPLAKDAHIGQLRPGSDPEKADEICRGFRLTQDEARGRFATYHVVDAVEIHDHYLWLPCWVDGTIAYRGKTFAFRANAASTLTTDWPDGQSKTLGGVYDDDLSGK